MKPAQSLTSNQITVCSNAIVTQVHFTAIKSEHTNNAQLTKLGINPTGGFY